MSVGSNLLYFTYDGSVPMTVTHNGTVYYYVTNLQGDVVAILDGSGSAVVQYTYDAWGNLLGDEPADDTIGHLNPLRYRGYVYDQETRLYYCQSRYYNPKVGRFLNADAYASTGQGLLGYNMFAYCGNNPTSRIDSDGLRHDTATQQNKYYAEATNSYSGLKQRYYSYLGDSPWDTYIKNSSKKRDEWWGITQEFFGVFESWEGYSSVYNLIGVCRKILEFDPIEAPLGVFGLHSGVQRFSNAVKTFAIFTLSPTDEIATAFAFAWGFYSIVNGIEKIFDWREST